MEYILAEAAHHRSKAKDTRKNPVKFYLMTAFLQDAKDVEEVRQHWAASLGLKWMSTGNVRGLSINLEKGHKASIKADSKKLWKEMKSSMHQHEGYHLQAFIELLSPARITELKETEISFGYPTFVLRPSWFKGVKNSNEDRARAFEYCSAAKSDGTLIEHCYCTEGWSYERVEGKAKSRVYLDVRDAVISGASRRELALNNDNGFLRVAASPANLEFFRSAAPGAPARFNGKRVGLILAAGRTGKSVLSDLLAIQHTSGVDAMPSIEVLEKPYPEEMYQVAAGGEGLSGFSNFDWRQHKVCVIDDFKGAMSKMGRGDLFQITDKRTATLRVLYKLITFYCEFVLINSQIHPRQWFNWNNDEYRKSMVGRFTDLWVMGPNYTFTHYTSYEAILAKLDQMETELGGQQLEIVQHQHNL